MDTLVHPPVFFVTALQIPGLTTLKICDLESLIELKLFNKSVEILANFNRGHEICHQPKQ